MDTAGLPQNKEMIAVTKGGWYGVGLAGLVPPDLMRHYSTWFEVDKKLFQAGNFARIIRRVRSACVTVFKRNTRRRRVIPTYHDVVGCAAHHVKQNLVSCYHDMLGLTDEGKTVEQLLEDRHAFQSIYPVLVTNRGDQATVTLEMTENGWVILCSDDDGNDCKYVAYYFGYDGPPPPDDAFIGSRFSVSAQDYYQRGLYGRRYVDGVHRHRLPIRIH